MTQPTPHRSLFATLIGGMFGIRSAKAEVQDIDEGPKHIPYEQHRGSIPMNAYRSAFFV
jgi:hypothetical protein